MGYELKTFDRINKNNVDYDIECVLFGPTRCGKTTFVNRANDVKIDGTCAFNTAFEEQDYKIEYGRNSSSFDSNPVINFNVRVLNQDVDDPSLSNLLRRVPLVVFMFEYENDDTVDHVMTLHDKLKDLNVFEYKKCVAVANKADSPEERRTEYLTDVFSRMKMKLHVISSLNMSRTELFSVMEDMCCDTMSAWLDHRDPDELKEFMIQPQYVYQFFKGPPDEERILTFDT
jgi:GTPase SAR1 family protein